MSRITLNLKRSINKAYGNKELEVESPVYHDQALPTSASPESLDPRSYTHFLPGRHLGFDARNPAEIRMATMTHSSTNLINVN